MKLHSVGISGVGSYLPEKIITNADLEKMVDTNDEWIVSRTGIRERRQVEDDVAVSDLCIIAAQRALADANLSPEDIDLILVATLYPDYAFPATACIVQAKLGASKAAAFDLEAGCSGFLYGIATGSQYVATGMYKHVLVIGAEILTKLMDFTDRSTCILFGDGAGAAVLSVVEDGQGFQSFVLGSHGDLDLNLAMPIGGSRTPITEQAIRERKNYTKMVGKEVFKFAVKIMGEAAAQAVQKAGLKTEDIDLLIPHQANLRIIDSAVKRLGIDPAKVFINVEKYGNMSAASIPVALDEALKQGRIKNGDMLVMVGFGAGLTWGACTLKWCKKENK